MEFISQFLFPLATTLLSFLIVLTIVVFIHELGHFLVGRWCGVAVSEFSIGFGREIFGFYDKHGTRWKLSVLPLGGYVKFVDDKNAAGASAPADPGTIPEEFRGRTFSEKSLGRRAAVVAAGPFANFILAITIFTGMFFFLGKSIAPVKIGEVLEGSAAEVAGFEVGDHILRIDDTKIESFSDLRRIVTSSAGVPLDFEIRRSGEPMTISVAPLRTEIDDGFGGTAAVGRIGIQSARLTAEDITKRNYGPVEAFVAGVNETWFVLERTILFVKGIFVGQESPKQLGGPIMIAQLSGHMASNGLVSLLNFVAIISISIGLLNLFPVPVLDGGHLLFYAYEALFGRPLGPRAQEIGFRIGFTMIIMMTVFVTWNDLLRSVRMYL